MVVIDFETRSYADLQKVGASAYSEDPTTDVICACWAVEDGPVQEWWPGKNKINNMPDDLMDAINDGHAVEAHNVAFERSIWANVLGPKYMWWSPPDDRWRDTMAVACYLALPASLDGLSRALGYGPKDPRGGRLISKYSKLHLKTADPNIPPEALAEFVSYCRDDVERERTISNELGPLPERELEVFQMSMEANARGMLIDREGVAAAAAVVDQRAGHLVEEFRALTALNPTQRDKVMQWCMKKGVELENMQAEYLEDLLEEGLPQGDVRRAIEIRTQINKASTSKLDAMARNCGRDGRARFQTRYHGAVTGRETGGGFQPLNLHKGFAEGVPPEQLVRDIMYEDPTWLDLVYGDAIDAVARAARHWIVAPEGSRIIAGDFVSIEAVALACLAGEQWKVDAFARGEDLYLSFVDSALGLAPGTATKETHAKERQTIGKPGELSGGYQGWLGAWLRFDKSGRWTDEEIKGFMGAWRDKHPAIVAFWSNLESAATQAVLKPDRKHPTGSPIWFEMQDEWLTMILPNSKRLWYRDPQIRAAMPNWHRPESDPDCAAGTCRCEPRPQLTYMAWKNKQWKRVNTYGGKLAENATQATCREILVGAQERVVAAGWVKPTPIVLTVYDEIVCEVPDGVGSEGELEHLMKDTDEEWLRGWPIGVGTWEGDRYRK